MTKSNWYHLFLPPVLVFYLLTDCGASFARLPDTVDFFVDPLMPRANDTLVLEADPFISADTKYPPKPSDYRWYYREMGSPKDAFRLIGIGPFLTYNITRSYRDGYFNLSVIYCCNNERQYVQRESVKLIRMQRPLSIQVFLNGNPLPGNQSVSSIALDNKYVNFECRISGMPTSFLFEPPLGVSCSHHKDRNKRRYLALVRRRCRFSPGILKCSAWNDISRVTMLHYVEVVVPGRKPKPHVKKGQNIPNNYDEIEAKEEKKRTNYIHKSDGVSSNEITVSSPKGNKNTPVSSQGTKKNGGRQCNCCTTTVAVATLTWLASVRH